MLLPFYVVKAVSLFHWAVCVCWFSFTHVVRFEYQFYSLWTLWPRINIYFFNASFLPVQKNMCTKNGVYVWCMTGTSKYAWWLTIRKMCLPVCVFYEIVKFYCYAKMKEEKITKLCHTKWAISWKKKNYLHYSFPFFSRERFVHKFKDIKNLCIITMFFMSFIKNTTEIVIHVCSFIYLL